MMNGCTRAIISAVLAAMLGFAVSAEAIEIENIQVNSNKESQNIHVPKAQARKKFEQSYQALIEYFESTGEIKQLESNSLLNLREEFEILLDLENRAEIAIIYPILLADRIEIVLIQSNGTFIKRTTSTTQESVYLAVERLRSALRGRRNRNFSSRSRQLYEWIIGPLEENLSHQNVNYLVFILGNKVNTIPFSSLYDGEKFLIENYTISRTVQALRTLPTEANKVLAMGIADTTKKFSTSDSGKITTFRGSNTIRREVDTIAGFIPTKQLLDEEFTKYNMVNSSQKHNILHFAIPGIIIPSARRASLFLGDGTMLTPSEIENLDWRHVDIIFWNLCNSSYAI